jgi:hypothetical protein
MRSESRSQLATIWKFQIVRCAMINSLLIVLHINANNTAGKFGMITSNYSEISNNSYTGIIPVMFPTLPDSETGGFRIIILTSAN